MIKCDDKIGTVPELHVSYKPQTISPKFEVSTWTTG